MKLTDKSAESTELIETPSDHILNNLVNGDFEDNNIINECCAKRLLLLCDDYGQDGRDAKKLLRMALEKIEVF